MGNVNFYRTYTMKCGKMGHNGFVIGNVNSPTETCLHVSFSVEKSTAESPNTAKVQVWNLSLQNLKILDSKDCILELKAGYDNSNALILAGNIANVATVPDGADRMTEIEVVDGMAELRDTNISVSFNGSVNCKTVYSHIAKAMGLPIVFAKDLSFTNMPNGFSFVGKGKTALQKAANACGHSWTIQNRVIQVTWPGRSVSARGFVLNSNTGLINRPKRITLNTSSDTKQTVTGWEVEYLLNGAIGINDIVKLESHEVNGYFLVHKVTMDGDNLEGDWVCTAQLLMIQPMPSLDKKVENASKKAASGNTEAVALKKGDKVKVTRTVKSGTKTKGYQYSGGMFTCYYSVYDVIQVKGDRVVIGIGSTVTAAVNAKDLAKA